MELGYFALAIIFVVSAYVAMELAISSFRAQFLRYFFA
jgi:hypothetical protein